MNDDLLTTTEATPLSQTAAPLSETADTERLGTIEQTMIEPASIASERSQAPSTTASIEDHISISELRYPVPEPVVGAQFGRYRIECELGRGGMGAVYRAFDTHLQRTVALKVPFFKKKHSEEIVKRFLREARAVARLSHPHLCRVFDVGLIDGTLFLTMEFVEGQSLDERAKTGALSEAEVVPVMRQVALALQEAHDCGIIHRDMKPANIMLNAKGQAVVMDFGLARQVDHEENDLTKDGAMLGTPSYMSPEQVRGKIREIGPATDIYSLGVVLYRLLTGRCPFEGAFTAILAAIPTETPSAPRDLCGTVSPAIEAICLKAMAKNPADRFASAAEMAAALDQALQESSRIEATCLTATPSACAPSAIERGNAQVDAHADDHARAHAVGVGVKQSAPSLTKRLRVISGVVAVASVVLIAAWWNRGESPRPDADVATQPPAVGPSVATNDKPLVNKAKSVKAKIDQAKLDRAKSGDTIDSFKPGSKLSVAEKPNGKLGIADPILETHLQRAQQAVGYEVLSQKSLPLHAHDKLQFHVTLNAASYVYLYLIDTNGMPTRLWPSTLAELEQQKPVTELWAPPLAEVGQKQKMYFLDDLHGHETVLVATSQQPLSQADLQSVESIRLNLALAKGDQPKLISFRREERERGIGGIVETEKSLSVEIDRFTERLGRVFDGYTGIVFPHE
ncbi:MAG: protein kinase domain-containing protein [Planctomycetaceae bacterium]